MLPSTAWKEGKSGNPSGRPKGYQSFVDRAWYLTGEYDIGKTEEILGDKAKFKRLSHFDGMILRRFHEAVHADGLQSMNALLDRLLGKPTQPIETKQLIINVTLDERKIEAQQEAALLLANAGLADMLGIEAQAPNPSQESMVTISSNVDDSITSVIEQVIESNE